MEKGMLTILEVVGGLFVTILVIVMVISGTNASKKKGDDMLNKGLNTMDNLAISDYTSIDTKSDITGDTVYNFIITHADDNDPLYVEVKTKKGGTAVYKSKKDGTPLTKTEMQTLKKAAQKFGDNNYINKSSKFTATCQYNGDNLIGILFEEN